MLSERQYFEAKYFLGLYKDALLCAEQVARKRSILSFHKDFYKKLQESYTKNHIDFDEKGHLIRTDGTKKSYYYQLFGICEGFVGRKINYNQSYNYEEFTALLDSIISSLKMEMNTGKNLTEANEGKSNN